MARSACPGGLMSTLEHWGVSAILERYDLDRERLETLQEIVRSPLAKRRVQRYRV